MPNSEPTIQCTNPHCLAFNDFNRRFCKQCKTPMIKRYLWAIKENKTDSEAKHNFEPEFEPETVFITQDTQLINSDWSDLANAKNNLHAENSLEQRYILISDRIYLDTKPGETPQIPEKLPEQIISYLQLFPYFPHIPQVYGQLDGTQIWLLDYGTVPVNRQGKLIAANLLPEITSIWSQTTSSRQLNWLRQIANLWNPLVEKGLTATLLNPKLIRVNSSFIQLLELEANSDKTPDFRDLGRLWQQWSNLANTDIQNVLIQLSQRMANGQINRIEQILTILDRAIKLSSQFYEYSYESFAISDSGPKRSNNQDRAYPNSELPIKNEWFEQSLSIVCDGVGGHEGGEIASQETVNYLCDRINQAIFWDEQSLTSANVLQQLLQFTNEVNDVISKRNDTERRQDRQRMGTTLVMTLAHHHEVFLSHIGDSRIYFITNNSCHQLTIDDDLASREVRLGYAVYRNALRYPSAGALIQALGMRHSAALHPNLQRVIVDDNCLFLLCTDGLSDFDRVEQYWRDVIAPVLENQSDLTKAVKTLVKIGNERNGHDNVTAALIHCQIRPKSTVMNTMITWSDVETSLEDSLLYTGETIGDSILPHQEAIASIATALPEDARTIQQNTRLSKKSSAKGSMFFWITLFLSFAFIVSLGLLIYAYTKDTDQKKQDSSTIQKLWNRERINEE
jgi:protein phosphatase